MSDGPAARKRLTTFAIVGGGPRGVDLIGVIAELARHALAKDVHLEEHWMPLSGSRIEGIG